MPPRSDQRTLIRRWLTRNPSILIAMFGGLAAFVLLSAFAIYKGCSGSGKNKVDQQTLEQSIFQSQKSFFGKPAAKKKYQHPDSFKPKPKDPSNKSMGELPPQNGDSFIQGIREQKFEDRILFEKALGKNTSKIYLAIENCWDDTDSRNDKVTGKVLELLLEKASKNPYLYSKVLKNKIWEGKKTWDRITTELMCLKPSQSNLIGKFMKEAFVLETKYSAQYEARDTVIPTVIKEMGSAFKAGTIGHDFVRQLLNQYAKDDYDRKQMFEKIDEAFNSADEALLLDDLYDYVNFKDFSYSYSKMSLAFFKGLAKRLGNKLNSHQKEIIRLINKGSIREERQIDLYLLFVPYITEKESLKELEPLKAKAELKNKADKEAKHLQNIGNIEHLKKLSTKELVECRLQSLNAFIVQEKEDEICEFIEILCKENLFALSEIPKDIDFVKLPKVKRLLFDKYLANPTAFLAHFAGKEQVLTLFLAECTAVADWTGGILVVGLSKATLLEIDAKNAYSPTLTLTEAKTSSLFSIAITNELPNLMLFLDKLLISDSIQALKADEKQKLIQVTVKLCKTDVLLNKYMKLIVPILSLIDLKDISFADKPISTATLIDTFCKNSDDLKDFVAKFSSQAALIEKAIEKVPLSDYTDFILTANLSIESAKSIDTKAKYTKASTLKATEPIFILLLEAAFEKELVNLQAALKNEIIHLSIKDVKSAKLLSVLVKTPEYAAIFTGLDAKTFAEKLKLAPTFLDEAAEECLIQFGPALLEEFAKDSQKEKEFSALLKRLKNLSSETIVAICAGVHEPNELLDAITSSKLNDIDSKACKPIILNALATNKKGKTFFALLKKKDWGTVEWFIGNLKANLVQQYRVDLVELFFIWYTDLSDDQLKTFVNLLPEFARFASGIKGMKAFTAKFVEDLLAKEAIFTDGLLKMFLSLFSEYQEPKTFIPLMIKLASKNYLLSVSQLWEKIFLGEDSAILYDELISHPEFPADVQLFKDKLSNDFIRSTFKKLNQTTCEKLNDLYGKEFYLSCLHATFNSVQAPEMTFKLMEMPADLITFMSLSREFSDLEKLLKVKSIKGTLDQIWFSDKGIVANFSDKDKLLALIKENLKRAGSETFFPYCQRGMSIVENTAFVKAFCPANGNVFGKELPKFLDFISKFDLKEAHLDAFAEEFIQNTHYLADYQTIANFFVASGNNLYFQKLMPYTKRMNETCFGTNAFVAWIFQIAPKALSGACKEHFMALMLQIKASIERRESSGQNYYFEYCQGSFAIGNNDLFAALCPVSSKMKEKFGENSFLTFLYTIVASFAAEPAKFPHVNAILDAFAQHKETYEGDYIKNCKEGFKYNNQIFSKMCPVVTTQDFVNKASHVQMMKEFLSKYGPEREHLKAILTTVNQQIIGGKAGSYVMEYFELGSSQPSNEPMSLLCPWTAKLASEKGNDSFRKPFKAILTAFAKSPESFPHARTLLEKASEAITSQKMHHSDFIALAQMGLDLDSNEILSKLAPTIAIEPYYKAESSFVTWFIQNINLLSKHEHSKAIAQVLQGEIQKGKLQEFYVKLCIECSESPLFALLNPIGPHFFSLLNNSEFKSWLPKKLASKNQQSKDLSTKLKEALVLNRDADYALHYCKAGAATKDNEIFASLCPIENNAVIEAKWKTNYFIDWFLVLAKDANLDHLNAMSLEFRRQFVAGNFNNSFDRIFPLAVDLGEEAFANVFPIDESKGILKNYFSDSSFKIVILKELGQLKSPERTTFRKCFQSFVDAQVKTTQISNENYLHLCQFGYQVSNEIFQLTCPPLYDYQKVAQFTDWFALVLRENEGKAYPHTLALAQVYSVPFVQDNLRVSLASLFGAAAIAGKSNELLKAVFPARQPEYFMNDSSWRKVLFDNLGRMDEFPHLVEIMGNVSARLKSNNILSFAGESCVKSAASGNNLIFASLCPVSTSIDRELSKGEFMRWVIGLSDDFEHKKALISELEKKITNSNNTKSTFCALQIAADHPLNKKYCLKK